MCEKNYDLRSISKSIHNVSGILKDCVKAWHNCYTFHLQKCCKCKKNVGIVCAESCMYACWKCENRKRKRPFEHGSKEELNEEYDKLVLYSKLKYNESVWYHVSEPSDPLTSELSESSESSFTSKLKSKLGLESESSKSESESSESESESSERPWYKCSDKSHNSSWSEEIKNW